MAKLLIESWFKRLVKSRVPEPGLSIRYFIEDALLITIPNLDLPKDASNLVITDAQADKIEKFIFRREHHEPIQYILGKWPFRDLELKMRSPVFIPRPETENLIDLIKMKLNQQMKSALEIGVGTGAISLSILKETDLNVYSLDKSKDAIELTVENLCLNKLESRKLNISQIDLCDDAKLNYDHIQHFLKTKCDVLVSNPPYIPYKQLFTLQPQVQWYESLDALNGGDDGLDVVRRILDIAKYIMNDKGLIFMELDETHPPLFSTLVQQNPQWNLKLVEICNDIFDRPRFVILQYIS